VRVRSTFPRRIKLKGADNLVADPKLSVDAKGYPALRAGSAAIDGAIRSTHYDIFRNTCGRDIRVDVTGQPRPTGGGWDIGAFEFRR
jgi:hypothetical protein